MPASRPRKPPRLKERPTGSLGRPSKPAAKWRKTKGLRKQRGPLHPPQNPPEKILERPSVVTSSGSDLLVEGMILAPMWQMATAGSSLWSSARR